MAPRGRGLSSAGSWAKRLVPVALLVFVLEVASRSLVVMKSYIPNIEDVGARDGKTRRSAGTSKVVYQYDPSPMEKYFIENLEGLGLSVDQITPTCPLIFSATSPVKDELETYFLELEAFNGAMKRFEPVEYDLRKFIEPGEGNIDQVCDITKIHPNGLKGIFTKSHPSSSNTVGFMEPLLPVFRSHKICNNTSKYLMAMDYLVHDFYSICKSLKRHSRTVFVDMGASLQFHGKSDSPAVYINKIFSKFGFKFDHIYAYEITKTEPADVYERVPHELMSSFHWINLGVDPEPGAKLNPFTTLLKNFDSDDFVVVKLDIDTPSVESSLAQQLRQDSKLVEIVDLFYFEHHRLQKELMPYWTTSANGSIGGSLELMADMRAKGVASHYWP